MALNYLQKTPRTIMQDLLVDPGPSVARGFAFPHIFGLPASGESVASGRAIDLGGMPGGLKGTLLVRSSRDMLGAAAEVSQIGKPVGSPRDLVERFAVSQINFDIKQFAAMAEELIDDVEHGLFPDEEQAMARAVARNVNIQIEAYARDHFTALAAESATAATTGGYTELDWQGGVLSGAAIGTSTNAITALHRAVSATRLAGSEKPNMAIIPQGVFERLQRDAELLGRIQNGNNWAVSGNAVANPDAAISVLKEHLGFSEVIIAAGAETLKKRGESYSAATDNQYIWPVDRMWIGCAADMDVKVNGNQPKVLNEAGAFGCLYSKVFETDIGYPENVGPQHIRCTVTTGLEMVTLSPEKGAIIYNMD
jgi:hypothetical protein